MSRSALGYTRFHKRTLCLEDLHSIDIRQWKKDGVLTKNQSFDYTWRNHLGVTGRIYLQLNDITLSVRYVMQTATTGYHFGLIKLTTTACHYGGDRYWFICPRCSRRAAKLYKLTQGFECRACNGLPYKSQNETASDRNIRRVRSVRRLLGANDNILEPIDTKPLGMHWTRFERLSNKASDLSSIKAFWQDKFSSSRCAG